MHKNNYCRSYSTSIWNFGSWYECCDLDTNDYRSKAFQAAEISVIGSKHGKIALQKAQIISDRKGTYRSETQSKGQAAVAMFCEAPSAF